MNNNNIRREYRLITECDFMALTDDEKHGKALGEAALRRDRHKAAHMRTQATAKKGKVNVKMAAIRSKKNK